MLHTLYSMISILLTPLQHGVSGKLSPLNLDLVNLPCIRNTLTRLRQIDSRSWTRRLSLLPLSNEHRPSNLTTDFQLKTNTTTFGTDGSHIAAACHLPDGSILASHFNLVDTWFVASAIARRSVRLLQLGARLGPVACAEKDEALGDTAPSRAGHASVAWLCRLSCLRSTHGCQKAADCPNSTVPPGSLTALLSSQSPPHSALLDDGSWTHLLGRRGPWL